MKITDVEPIVLRNDVVDPERADGTQDAFLVRVHTDEGIVGVGEADTAPTVARAIVEMPPSHAIARGLRELLVGEDPLDRDRLWARMYRGSYHYGRDGAGVHAMSAIDLALWDIAGKAAGVPVCTLLGGARSDVLEVYASEVMPDSTAEVRDIAALALDGDFTGLKLGWGPLGKDLRHDVALAEAARDALGPERRFMLDAGMVYTVQAARQLCRRLADIDLFWFEEPFEAGNFAAYRRLARAVDVSLACGEAHSTLRPFVTLIDDVGVDVVQPDLGRCGGFTVAARIAALADAAGVVVVPHCFSTDVLLAASLQFAATLNGVRLLEFPVTASARAASVVTEPIRPDAGLLHVPTGPGLGIELDEDEIKRRRVLH